MIIMREKHSYWCLFVFVFLFAILTIYGYMESSYYISIRSRGLDPVVLITLFYTNILIIVVVIYAFIALTDKE
jgi:hypothetical protein